MQLFGGEHLESNLQCISGRHANGLQLGQPVADPGDPSVFILGYPDHRQRILWVNLEHQKNTRKQHNKTQI